MPRKRGHSSKRQYKAYYKGKSLEKWWLHPDRYEDGKNKPPQHKR